MTTLDGGSHLPGAPRLSQRRLLAVLLANTAWPDRSGHIGGELRQLLRAECDSAGWPTCQYGGGTRGVDKALYQNSSTLLAAYQQARFCLQPWGDTATRKAFWDALSAGCINAVFTDAGWNATDAWFGDHRQWTVRVPLTRVRGRAGGTLTAGGSGTGGVLAFLRSIPAPEIARLHANVLAVRGRVHYGLRAGSVPGGDAVDTIVARVGGALRTRRLRGLASAPREGTLRGALHELCVYVRQHQQLAAGAA